MTDHDMQPPKDDQERVHWIINTWTISHGSDYGYLALEIAAAFTSIRQEEREQCREIVSQYSEISSTATEGILIEIGPLEPPKEEKR